MKSPPLPSLARDVWQAAARAASPGALLAALPWPTLPPRPLADYRRATLVGAGKAAMAMAGAAERALAEHLAPNTDLRGAVTVPHGYPAAFPPDARRPRRVLVREAAHPVPDAAGAAAADEALALCAAAAATGGDHLVVALVSGGGSALWPAPPPGVTLDDLRATSALLLASGAPIADVNAVRKHLSRVAGGQLAAAAAPAHVLALVLSDVTGDDPAVVAGGPAAADPTTFADAAAVLAAYGLWGRVPNAVRAHLAAGRDGRAAETVKPGDPALSGVRARVAGTNAHALAGARDAARALGYAARVVDPAAAGEARDAGAAAAAAVLEAAAAVARGAAGPTCLLWGGETTVTVRGPGRGGRNQECALAAALAFERAGPPPPGVEAVYLAAGTDGVDGPTHAAGAWVTPAAAAAARRLGVDPDRALAANDSHTALADLAALHPPDVASGAGGLLVTGPTHTNVMDVHLALVRPAAARP